MNFLKKLAKPPAGDHSTLDGHLGRILQDYAIDLVIDVGANEGQFGKRLRAIGYRGEIHSFEPVSATFERLQAAAAGDSLWRLNNCALGTEKGEAQINVSKSSDFSSLLEPSAFGAESFKGLAHDHKETIRIERADVLLADVTVGRSVFLKMDTQGFDLEVFRGAAGILDRVSAMMGEISFIPAYQGMPGYRDQLDAYAGAGFSVSGLFAVTRNKKTHTLIEMDCVLVRESARL